MALLAATVLTRFRMLTIALPDINEQMIMSLYCKWRNQGMSGVCQKENILKV